MAGATLCFVSCCVFYVLCCESRSHVADSHLYANILRVMCVVVVFIIPAIASQPVMGASCPHPGTAVKARGRRKK